MQRKSIFMGWKDLSEQFMLIGLTCWIGICQLSDWSVMSKDILVQIKKKIYLANNLVQCEKARGDCVLSNLERCWRPQDLTEVHAYRTSGYHIICFWPCSCGTDVQSHHSSASFLLLAGDWWETGSLPVQGNQVCQLPRFQLQPVSGERLHLWALPQRSGPLPLPGELHQKVVILTNLSSYLLCSLFN